jgi:hypothetical protein
VVKRLSVASACTALVMMTAVSSARADLIQGGPVPATGAGFGTSGVILTVHSNTSTESASVAPVGGAPFCTGDLSGSCAAPHYSVPTLGSLGWTTATDVGLILNAAEPGADEITIPAGQLVLTFYDGNTPIFSINNTSALVYNSTFPGQGNIGFLIGVSPGEIGDVNTAVFSLANFQDLRVGLSAGFTSAGGGQEDFTAALGAVTVPGPVVGAGLPGLVAACLGLVALARRRRGQWSN